METFETKSATGTIALGRRLARRLSRGDCVGLIGPLGAGKTVLVRGMAEALGLADPRMARSPTFVLVNEYQGRVPIYHVDLYRLRLGGAELSGLGLEEMLVAGVVLVEWADRAEEALPRPRWQVDIQPISPRRRRVTLQELT